MSLKDFESVFSKLYRSHGENLPKLLDTFFENLKKNKDDFLPEDEDIKMVVVMAAQRNLSSCKFPKETDVGKIGVQNAPMRNVSPPERNENVDKKSDENARKLANVPVKGKADRKKLLGYECSECRSYYTSLNLEEAKRNEIVQNCSRHRATIKPPPDSPKGTKDMPCNMYSKLFYT